MRTQRSTKNTQERNHHKQRLTPNGTVFEFLASPDEAGAEICLIRGTLPPGVAVPLHSHPDVEVFYLLEGSAECFQSTDGAPQWTTVSAGDVVAITGNIQHAWRNSSRLPATMILVTTSKMYEFFLEVTKPFDPDQSASPPGPEAIQSVFETAARYGYWMGSAEENAAIGLSLGSPTSKSLSTLPAGT
jgi:quercetin dioxygenase-like cupin family protein